MNYVYYPSRCLNSQPPRTDNTKLQPRFLHSLLLIVLIGKYFFHCSCHQDFEEEWCLILAITSSDGSDNSNTFYVILFHCTHDNVGAISEHCFTNISRLPSEAYDYSINLSCFKDLCNVSCISHISLNHDQLV